MPGGRPDSNALSRISTPSSVRSERPVTVSAKKSAPFSQNHLAAENGTVRSPSAVCRQAGTRLPNCRAVPSITSARIHRRAHRPAHGQAVASSRTKRRHFPRPRTSYPACLFPPVPFSRRHARLPTVARHRLNSNRRIVQSRRLVADCNALPGARGWALAQGSGNVLDSARGKCQPPGWNMLRQSHGRDG